MKQIISLGVGQCGIRMANEFYNLLLKEHQIDQHGQSLRTNNNDGYFQQNKSTFNPRLIVVDTEPGEIDQMRANHSLLPTQNCINSYGSTGNNYARGYHEFATQLMPNVNDAIRRAAEKCDTLEAIQIYHSIGGGTGSGLGSKINSELGNCYRAIYNYAVFPSKKVSDVIVQPYNAAFCLPQLVYSSSFTLMISNQKLYERASKVKSEKINYKLMNKTIAQVLSDCTVINRFPDGGSSFTKLLTNMIPFPRNHFFGFSLAGVQTHSIKSHKACLLDLFNPANHLIANTDIGPYLGINPILRGDIDEMSLIRELKYLCDKHDSHKSKIIRLVKWFDNFTVTRSNKTRGSSSDSVSVLYNGANVCETFRQISESAWNLANKKAFMHHYTQNGMEQAQFSEAASNINDLISDYDGFSIGHCSCCGWDEQESSDILQ